MLVLVAGKETSFEQEIAVQLASFGFTHLDSKLNTVSKEARKEIYSIWKPGSDVLLIAPALESQCLNNVVLTGVRSIAQIIVINSLYPACVLYQETTFTTEDLNTLAAYQIPAGTCMRGMGVRKLRQLILELASQVRRPEWDEYFMKIVHIVAARSNCLKRKVGAIIVREKRIISTGYNGTPFGAQNCNQGGCLRCASLAESGKNLSECLCSHAEENALIQAARYGIPVAGASLYSTACPCLSCAKMIINSRIEEVVYASDYPVAAKAVELLKKCKVRVRQFKHC